MYDTGQSYPVIGFAKDSTIIGDIYKILSKCEGYTSNSGRDLYSKEFIDLLTIDGLMVCDESV